MLRPMSRRLLAVLLSLTLPAAAGASPDWAVVGPFDLDLDIVGEPETAFIAGEQRSVFDGATHPVRWHPVGAAVSGGRIDLARVVNLRDGGVVYLRGRIHTMVEAPITARVHSAGGWRLFFGEERVGGGPGVVPESAPDSVTRWRPPGRHDWLLKVVVRPGRSTVRLRWARADDIALDAATPAGPVRPVAVRTAPVTPWPTPAERWRQLMALDSPAGRLELARFEAARGLPLVARRLWRAVVADDASTPAQTAEASDALGTPGWVDPRARPAAATSDPLNPERPGPWVALGDARCAAGDVSGAVGAWRKALVYDPGMDDVRVALAVLERPGMPPLSATPSRAGRCVPDRRPNMLLPPQEGTLDREVVELRRDGAAVRLRQIVTDDPDVQIIGESTGEVVRVRAEVLSDAGPIPCTETCARRPGERVHLAWLTREEVRWAIGATVAVAGKRPVDRWVYEVRLPSGWPLSWDARGVEGPDTRRAGDVHSWTWTARGVPARPPEIGGPELAPGDAFLAYGSFADWSALGRWFLHHLGQEEGPWLLVRSPKRGWLPDVPALGAFDNVVMKDEPRYPHLGGGEALRIHVDGRVERIRLPGEAPWRVHIGSLVWVDGRPTLVDIRNRATAISGAAPPVRALARHGRLGRRARPLVMAPERTRWKLHASGRRPPPDVRVESEFGAYARTSQLTGDGWKTVRTLELSGGAIPADRYPAFREFLRRVDRADARGWPW